MGAMAAECTGRQCTGVWAMEGILATAGTEGLDWVIQMILTHLPDGWRLVRRVFVKRLMRING